MTGFGGAPFRWPITLVGVLAVCLLPCGYVRAQESDGGYRSTEADRVSRDAIDRGVRPDDPNDPEAVPDDQTSGPVRLARFSAVSGDVTWRPDSGSVWSAATINLPIRQGAEISVTNGGRADLQFDDGSELRLGNGALAILKTLYSDHEGEFTQIAINDGLATMHSRHESAVYQLDTPGGSVKSHGASQIRVGVDGGSEITVQHGDATIEGPQGTANLRAGDYLYIADSGSPFEVRSAPASDNWDRWNDERNRVLEGRPTRHVPSNIGLVSGELDDYGDWRSDPTYGTVWCPRVASGWRPYYDGRWTWVDPFGWTWVGNEPWGWAPYHYGTWVRASYGWGWCPGPLHQYWSPAVVHFSVYDDCVAWAPLCPSEVHYPSSLSFGYWGRDWAFSFSIGSCGVYYPYGGYCIGRPWTNFYVNSFAFGRGGFRDRDFRRDGPGSFSRGAGSPAFDRFSRTNEFAAANSHFVPFNARHANGASFARTEAFGGQGRYQPLAAGTTSYFERGRGAAPPAGGAPVAGPPRVAPTAIGRTPTRSFAQGGQPSQTALNRQVYSAPQRGNSATGSRSGIGASGRGDTTTSPPGIGSRGRSSDSAGIGGGTRQPTRPTGGYGDSTGASRQPTRPTGGFGDSTGVTRQPGQSGGSDTSAQSIRPSPYTSGRGRGTDSSSSAAEAARQARSSLGLGGGSGSSGSRSSTGRATSDGSYGGGASTRTPDSGYRSSRSTSSGDSGAGSSRTYGSSGYGSRSDRSAGSYGPGSTRGSGADYGTSSSSSRYGSGSPYSRSGGSGYSRSDTSPYSRGGSSDYSPSRSRSSGDYGPSRSSGGGSYGGSGRSSGSDSGGGRSGGSSSSGGGGGRSSGGGDRSGGSSGGGGGRSGGGGDRSGGSGTGRGRG